MPKTRHGARVRTGPFPTAKPSPFQAPFGRFSAESLPVQIEYDAGVAGGWCPSAVDTGHHTRFTSAWEALFQAPPRGRIPGMRSGDVFIPLFARWRRNLPCHEIRKINSW